MLRSTLVFSLLLLTFLSQAQNVTVSGALVGNGSYPTLTAAFAAINAGAQTSATITVGIIANTNEGSGTAVLNAGAWTTLLVTPSGGARTIMGATTAGQAMIHLNGADKVTFNGQLPGGVRGLTLENTTVSGSAGTSTLSFGNDASMNTFTSCNLYGAALVNDTAEGGTIFFTPGTGVNGNDNNIISFCDIGPSGTNLPTRAVFAVGGVGENTSNRISNCNIYDVFHPSIPSNGIVLVSQNLQWIIQNNRFYQTMPRRMVGTAIHRDILLNGTIDNHGHDIVGNIFGFADSFGTGLSVFQANSANAYYIPIGVLGSDNDGSCAIHNNLISGISFPVTTLDDQAVSFIGIDVLSGNIDVFGNTIGSTTVAGSISATNPDGAANFMGINVGAGAINVNSNAVAGFQLDVSTLGSINFTGIRCINTQAPDNNLISSNQVGAAVAPVVVNGVGSNDHVIGIHGHGIDIEYRSNTVHYLSSKTSCTSTGAGAGLIGILTDGNASNQDLLLINQVYALESTHPSAAVTVVGMVAIGVDQSSRNLVHTLSATSPNAKIVGVQISAAALTRHSNNMIRLGRDRLGQSLTNGISITGWCQDFGAGDLAFNSVYIGGDNVGGSALTYAYHGAGNNNWRNNIFYNGRSNGSGTGLHYAAYITANTPAQIPLSNGNDFYVSGNGGRLGYLLGQEVLTLPAWQLLSGQDANSISSNPNYLNPDGNLATGDLHIGAISPIEAAGQPFNFVNIDYDNQARSGWSPVDIGADAGNFQAQLPQLPEILLTGNAVVVTDGDTTVSAADGTDFGWGNCTSFQPHPFVIQNTGAAPLIISYSGFSGTGAAQFSVVTPPPGVLQPGQSATIFLAFTPSVAGLASAQFNLHCNDWDETDYNFAVQGSTTADTIPPTAVCNPLNVYLDSGGVVHLNGQSLAAGSTDNCGVVSYSTAPASFSCAQRGVHSVLVQIADQFALDDTCTAAVTVIDSTRPQASCPNAIVSVGSSGAVALTPAMILASATDNCGIDTITLSLASVSCADVGVVPVLVSALDLDGNLDTCTALVTVQAVPLGASLLAPATNACGFHIACAGMTVDSVPALAAGGCMPYTYAWSNGQTGTVATNLGAGLHSVTVTDGTGATAVQSIQLSEPSVLNVTTTVVQSPCQQDSTGVLSVAATGGNACQPYAYLWSNGATASSVSGLAAGTYIVTVTDVAGCTAMASIVLPAIPTPQPFISLSHDTLFCSPGFVSHQWNFNGLPIAGATAFFHEPTAFGFYSVTVTDSNGCLGTSSDFYYSVLAGEPRASLAPGFQVFPNPSEGLFSLRSSRAIVRPLRVSLCDLSGKVLAVWEFSDLAEQRMLDARGLAAGSYLLWVEVKGGLQQVLCVVLE